MSIAAPTVGRALGPTGLPVLSRADVLAGRPTGAGGRPDIGSRHADPAAALRAQLLPALLRPPCLVAFSGGRDSSALLAVAADLAASTGLAQPVAVIVRYPDDPHADESAWQERVMAHLAR